MKENKKSPKIIIITGAESTGKSVLTKQLAKHYDAPFYPEYAREYILNLKRKYNFSDIEIIARKQLEQYKEALDLKSEYVFFDTWLIITKVWFEIVYKTCPEWISDEISSAKIFGVLLNNTDLPWEPDKVRENGGKNRQLLHELYITNLKNYNFDFSIINEKGNKRLKNAINILEKKFD